MAAAIFGEDGHVEYVPVSAFDRFRKLKEGDYDMLSRTTTHTMERQVLEVRFGCCERNGGIKRATHSQKPALSSRLLAAALVLVFPTCTMVCSSLEYGRTMNVPTTQPYRPICARTPKFARWMEPLT